MNPRPVVPIGSSSGVVGRLVGRTRGLPNAGTTLMNFATLAPAPTISSISPNTATLAGNVPCVITGTGFTGATALTFGAMPAMAWKVTSDTKIHCTMFPVASAGGVTVTVTTAGGTATKAFTFNSVAIAGTVSNLTVADPASGQTFYPVLGEDSNLWMGAPGALARVKPDGTVDTFSIAGVTYFYSLTSGPDGNLWGVDGSNATVFKMSLAGALLATFSIDSGTGMKNQFILAGPDGKLWILQQEPGAGNNVSLVRMATDGTFSTYNFDPAYKPYFMCFTPSGYLWLTDDFIPNLYKFDPVGFTLLSATTLAVPGTGQYLEGMCVAGDGNLWLPCNADLLTDSVVVKVVPGTLAQTNYSVPTLYYLFGATAGPDGNVWVTSNNGVTASKFERLTLAGANTVHIILTGSESYGVYQASVDVNGGLNVQGIEDDLILFKVV